MKYISLSLTVSWFVFMTFLSHQKGSDTAETSMRLAEMLGKEAWNGLLRKMAHVIVFLVLAILVSATLMFWKLEWQYVCLIFLWCILDEATKPLVVGRHFAWCDVELNMIGTIIGIIIGQLIWRFL